MAGMKGKALGLLGGAVLFFLAGGVVAWAEEEAWRVVAFGDSTTAPRGGLPVYPVLLERALQARGMRVEVINAGRGGDTTAGGRSRFRDEVLARKPAIAIIQFGINDAARDVWRDPPALRNRLALPNYLGNLEHFVERLRGQGSAVILMTPNPLRWTPELKRRYGKVPYLPDDPDGFNVTMLPYVEGVRALAKRRKTALVDVDALFRRHGEGDGQEVGDLLLDGMHPNAVGHALIASALEEEILRIWRERQSGGR